MEKLKNIGLWTIFVVFLLLMINNTKKQLDSLLNARRENLELERKIEVLEKSNSDLERKIKHASESAYFYQQQARDMLGLGTSNDYWVTIEDVSTDLFPEINVIWQVPVYQQWLNLFTKQN